MSDDFDSAFYSYLISRSELTTLVGQNIFPSEAYMGSVYPSVTYSDLNETQSRNLTGDDPICWVWFQLTIYATTSSDRRAIQNTLRNILSGQINKLLTYTGGSVILSTALLMSSGKDRFESPSDGSDTGIFERSMIFKLCFRQTVPTL